MSAEGKSSGYISMPNLMPFPTSDLSANAQRPENVVNEQMDRRTDGVPNEWLVGITISPLNLVQDKNVVRM